MKLYDSVIRSLCDLIGHSYEILPLGTPLEEGAKDQMLFKSSIRAELGGGTFPGVSGILYGSSFDEKDEIWLIGNDLPKIDRDTPYARFVLVKTDEEKLGTGNELYKTLRKIDYTRYHLNPDGFMVRVSPISKKESLVVDKKKKNVSFSQLGSYVIQKYKEAPAVLSVKVLFITDPIFDYKELSALATKSDEITTALDHLLNKVKMDCNTCKLQPVCNEVEALCKEDFS